MVQIAAGMFLGQASCATATFLARFHPRPERASYHYQNFGYFLLFEPFWNAEAKRLFPFLEMPDVAVPADVPRAAAPAATASSTADKFSTLTLADPPDGDVDAARLDEVRADLKSAGD